MKKTIAAVAISMLSATAVAQEAGWYVGGAFGRSEVKDFCGGFATGTSCDDTEVTLKAMGGYQFSRNFALEMGLTGVGEFEASGTGQRTTINIGIAEGAGVLILPLGDKFSVFGKFGMYTANVETRTENIFGGTNTEDKRSTDLTYGAGVGFAVTPKLQVRGEWQRYQDVESANFRKSDVDIVTLGVVYRFF